MKNNEDIKLNVTEIQRFCMHDGPGVRTTVFLKGCPLRCVWCHNPETRRCDGELLLYKNKCISCRLCEGLCDKGAHIFDTHHSIDRKKCIVCGICAAACPTEALSLVGRKMPLLQILESVKKDAAFYGAEGGVTLSGGEPLMQGYSAVALLRACRGAGFNTAVETSGYVDEGVLAAAVPYTNLFLWDIKDTDSLRHQRYTGVENEKIINNLLLADSLGGVTQIRCILVSGVNTDRRHYECVAELFSNLTRCLGVELIPYHTFGGAKAEALGLADNGNVDFIPTEAQISEAREVLSSCGVPLVG